MLTTETVAVEDQVTPKRLDLRVGRIVCVETVSKLNIVKLSSSNYCIKQYIFCIHMFVYTQVEDSGRFLYIKTVDVGEAEPRKAISDLVNVVSADKLEGRLGVFVCNLKPMKRAGVESRALMLSAIWCVV